MPTEKQRQIVNMGTHIKAKTLNPTLHNISRCHYNAQLQTNYVTRMPGRLSLAIWNPNMSPKISDLLQSSCQTYNRSQVQTQHWLNDLQLMSAAHVCTCDAIQCTQHSDYWHTRPGLLMQPMTTRVRACRLLDSPDSLKT